MKINIFVQWIILIIAFSSCTITKTPNSIDLVKHLPSQLSPVTQNITIENLESEKPPIFSPVLHDIEIENSPEISTVILDESARHEELYNSTILSLNIEIKDTIPNNCDRIILDYGEEIRGKVTEITEDEIKYTSCVKSFRRVYTIDKDEVVKIVFADGHTEIIKEGPIEPEKQIINEFAIVSFVLMFFVTIFPVLFGIIALRMIKKNPKKYRGRKLAIAAIIVGTITTSISAFFIYVML